MNYTEQALRLEEAGDPEEARPYTEAPGRRDRDGVEWLACDPYPTWYRWQGGKLIVRRTSRPVPWEDA